MQQHSPVHSGRDPHTPGSPWGPKAAVSAVPQLHCQFAGRQHSGPQSWIIVLKAFFHFLLQLQVPRIVIKKQTIPFSCRPSPHWKYKVAWGWSRNNQEVFNCSSNFSAALRERLCSDRGARQPALCSAFCNYPSRANGLPGERTHLSQALGLLSPRKGQTPVSCSNAESPLCWAS